MNDPRILLAARVEFVKYRDLSPNRHTINHLKLRVGIDSVSLGRSMHNRVQVIVSNCVCAASEPEGEDS